MPEPLALGSIGRRSLAALLAVALTSITVLVVATIAGIDLTRSAAERTAREDLTAELALAAAGAYRADGRWDTTALDRAQAVATEAGGHLVVLDPADSVVFGGPVGPGFGTRALGGPVIVDGQQVATVSVGFPTGLGPSSAPSINPGWLIAATLLAMAVALLLALHLTRRLTAPLTELTEATRAFASGDRDARASTTGPGEIGELAVAFNAMADEVSRVEAARRHLSADLAHELRTPLTALQASLEELRIGLEPADPQTLGALHDQATRMGRTLNDLSELSQAEAAGPDMEMVPLDLAELIDDVLAAWRGQLRASGLTVGAELAPGTWVLVDPDRMHQVIGNLLANAGHYCRPGDRILVSLGRDHDDAVLSVADTGPGMAPEDVPHAFDRFWRGAPGTAPGSGLGLPVARALVQAQGGRITLDSAVGRGTTITIRLPPDRLTGVARTPAPGIGGEPGLRSAPWPDT
jgi:two-component system sensor histidine kinase BaeS